MIKWIGTFWKRSYTGKVSLTLGFNGSVRQLEGFEWGER